MLNSTKQLINNPDPAEQKISGLAWNVTFGHWTLHCGTFWTFVFNLSCTVISRSKPVAQPLVRLRAHTGLYSTVSSTTPVGWGWNHKACFVHLRFLAVLCTFNGAICSEALNPALPLSTTNSNTAAWTGIRMLNDVRSMIAGKKCIRKQKTSRIKMKKKKIGGELEKR